MGYFWPMPNFDIDRFPFLITCGDQSINLVDIKE